MQRILVVGTSGSGKSTLAKELGARLQITHIELDSVYWQPGWKTLDDTEFLASVQQRIEQAGGRWVIDGNYSAIRDHLLAQADTVIWLDYSLALILWRITVRTFRRVFGKQQLWNGNVETFRTQFLSKDSMFLWVLQTYQRRKKQYSELLASDQYPHIAFIRLQSPQQTSAWIDSL
jgi:adenylate kinase family enzyme